MRDECEEALERLFAEFEAADGDPAVIERLIERDPLAFTKAMLHAETMSPHDKARYGDLPKKFTRN